MNEQVRLNEEHVMRIYFISLSVMEREDPIQMCEILVKIVNKQGICISRIIYKICGMTCITFSLAH